MTRISTRAAIASILVATAAPALAQYGDFDDMRYAGDRNGWQTIGRKGVNGQVDFDQIRVRGDARYKKIRVCSINRAFELRQMSAVYHNGGRQQFATGMVIGDGRCTRAFDLAGRRRNIDNIYLTYSRVGWGSVRPQLIVQAR